MAVAPINMVRRVAEYALTQIPRGEDHPGNPKLRLRLAAPLRARYHPRADRWEYRGGPPGHHPRGADPVRRLAQSPYSYNQDGVRHEVWFEDVRSYRAKFELIKELGLKGPGYFGR